MDPAILISFLFLPAIALQFRALKLWDEAMEALHGNDLERWEALGRPVGFFWRPESPKLGILEGIGPRRRLQWAITRELPDWVPEGSRVALKFASWRLANIVSLGAFAFTAVFVAFGL
jgi:hypothetical protein